MNSFFFLFGDGLIFSTSFLNWDNKKYIAAPQNGFTDGKR